MDHDLAPLLQILQSIAVAPFGANSAIFKKQMAHLVEDPLYPVVKGLEPILFRLFTAEITAQNAFYGLNGQYSGRPPAEITDMGAQCQSILEGVNGITQVTRWFNAPPVPNSPEPN